MVSIKMFINMIALGLICFGADGAFFQKNVFKLDVFKGCSDEFEDPDFLLYNVSINTDNSRKSLVDATLKFKKSLNSTYRGEAKVMKCESKEVLDSCLNFHLLKFPDGCFLLSVKKQIWSTLVGNVHPQLKCPVTKGIYLLKGGYLDADWLPFPMDPDCYWKFRYTGIDKITGKVEICFKVEGRLVPIRYA